MTKVRVSASALAGLVFLLFCAPELMATEGAGVFDLRHWNLQEEPVQELHGQWLARWGSNGEAGRFQLPGGWRGAEISGQQRGRFGRAEFQARILLPEETDGLALHLGYIKSAVRVYVNGEPVAQRGTPADDAAAEEVDFRPLLVPLPDAEALDVRLVVSNHFHSDGGPDRFLRIGDRATLQQQLNSERTRVLLLLAALAALVVYIGMLSLWQGAFVGSGLFVLLLLLSIARIAAVTGMLDEVAAISAAMRFRIDYASASAVPAVHLLLLRTLFPAVFPSMIARVVVAVSLLLLASLLLLVSWFTLLRDGIALFVMVTGLVALLLLTRAVRRRLSGAVLLLVGSLFFAIATFNDALVAVRMLDTPDLTGLGAMVFLLAHGLVVGGRVFETLRSNEHLSGRLHALNRSLEQQVAERTRALEQAHREARRDARHKTRLLNVLSHEIRTPLQGILGHAELLRRNSDHEASRRRLEIIRETGEGLERLVEDMLALGYLEGDLVEPRRDVVAPRELVDHVLSVVQPRAAQKGVQLHGSVSTDIPSRLVGDAVKLRQILLNLLDNAVRVSDAGSIEISMTPAARDGYYQLHVCDQGPGMGRERARRYLREFEHDTQSPGVGLGLFIVSRLVPFLGGSMEIENRPQGGACFTLELPLAEPDDPDSPAVGVLSTDAGLLRILLVEDDPANRVLLAELLAAEGHEVVAASGAENAVQRAGCATEAFDVVLVDYRLEGADGLELCEKLQSLPATSASVRLLLTAEAREGSRMEPWSAQVHGVLAKPLKLEQLYRAVKLCGYDSGRDAPPSEGASMDDFSRRLQELEESLGEDVIAGLLNTLAESLQQAREDLRRARAREDATGSREVAHRVAGSAANYGLRELARAATAVRSVSEPRLGTALDDFEHAIGTALDYIRQATAESTTGELAGMNNDNPGRDES